MSRRKNGVRKEWKRRLTEINTLKKRLKKVEGRVFNQFGA